MGLCQRKPYYYENTSSGVGSEEWRGEGGAESQRRIKLVLPGETSCMSKVEGYFFYEKAGGIFCSLEILEARTVCPSCVRRGEKNKQIGRQYVRCTSGGCYKILGTVCTCCGVPYSIVAVTAVWAGVYKQSTALSGNFRPFAYTALLSFTRHGDPFVKLVRVYAAGKIIIYTETPCPSLKRFVSSAVCVKIELQFERRTAGVNTTSTTLLL